MVDPAVNRLELNCDLGEGEPLARTRALMRWIDSANIACGGHAGDARSMRACVRLAKQFKVNVGAHPGPWSRADLGRGRAKFTPDELELLLLHQVGALEKIAAEARVPLHHIKLHGALYHAVEADAKLARRYCEVVVRHWPRAIIYGFTRGHVLPAAGKLGLRTLAEGFADRAYQRDGWLVPRAKPGAVLDDAREVLERLDNLLSGRGIQTIGGEWLKIRIQTLCVHADSPNSVHLVRALASELRTERRSPDWLKPNKGVGNLHTRGSPVRPSPNIRTRQDFR